MKLIIERLSKTYPNGTQALKNVSLEISTGMFGLLGPNGAGKSSLMRTIATLQEADSGSIMLDDMNVLKEKKRVREILGYLPQEFGVYPKMTAVEMLDHFALLKGISKKNQRRELVDNILNQTNLYNVRHKKLGKFSGGMKQRFGIAQALLGDPKLIIVDEPTAGLDPAERNRFHNLLSEIGEHIIIILSTHIVEDVSDLCQEMAIIHRGEVLLKGNPLESMHGIEGKIWKTVIDKQELPEFYKKYNVISTRLFGGKVIVKVYDEEEPDEFFDNVLPELEDVYFSTVKKHDKLLSAI
ncbi:ABC transporter ATP-binding protein [Fulvivirgaceae bacterium BMA10]|uniref:ABC transporter ATP-binding protein n=1 Tax=Splendidivirga corallicola TaxID=3051826 RepID=A0ABT8KJX7_9BACT|nr:ABC transporter ATP-binding protein [Fulvivirgaceae bacterium BMA10]